jgi:hypothetical protein
MIVNVFKISKSNILKDILLSRTKRKAIQVVHVLNTRKRKVDDMLMYNSKTINEKHKG